MGEPVGKPWESRCLAVAECQALISAAAGQRGRMDIRRTGRPGKPDATPAMNTGEVPVVAYRGPGLPGRALPAQVRILPSPLVGPNCGRGNHTETVLAPCGITNMRCADRTGADSRSHAKRG